MTQGGRVGQGSPGNNQPDKKDKKMQINVNKWQLSRLKNMKWHWSQLLPAVLCSLDEVVIYCSAHLEPSVVSEMKLLSFDWLTPVFPAVRLHVILVVIAIPVVIVPGDLTHAVCVETGVKGGGVSKVELSDFGIKPINFLNLILIVAGLSSIVVKPRYLWWI